MGPVLESGGPNGDLCAADVGTVGGADFQDVAFFDEEGDLYRDTCFEGGGLGGVVGGVAFDALRGLGDGEFDVHGQVDGDGSAFEKENFNFLAFFEVVLGVADEGFIESDGLVGVQVHKVEACGVGVGELEFLAVGFDDFHFVRGREADGLFVTVVERANGGGDKGVAFAGGAVLETEDDSTITFIFDTLPFFEIGCYNCHVDEG